MRAVLVVMKFQSLIENFDNSIVVRCNHNYVLNILRLPDTEPIFGPIISD